MTLAGRDAGRPRCNHPPFSFRADGPGKVGAPLLSGRVNRVFLGTMITFGSISPPGCGQGCDAPRPTGHARTRSSGRA